MLRTVTISLLLLCGASAFPQVLGSFEKKAASHLKEKKWEKAFSAIQRLLKKDQHDPLAHYLLSRYYFNRENPAYQLDSAYLHTILSLDTVNTSTEKTIERLLRLNLDTTHVIRLRQEIDSAVFDQVRLVNTEQAYIDYLQNHPHSLQRQKALESRDEVAYLNAFQQNTHTAYRDFLQRYPQAKRAAEAKRKYERLLYESSTRDKQLSSYERFLKEHPETPFRAEIDKNIYELSTLTGEIDRYISFLQQHPQSKYANRAKAILYHLVINREDEQLELFSSDSTRALQELNKQILVPVLKNKRFGFMTAGGREVIEPLFSDLPDEYRCGDIREDLLVMNESILARNGAVLYRGKVEELVDIGAGFVKIKTNDCVVVLHKSGAVIDSCTNDAKVMGSRFLAVKKNDSWMLQAFSGRAVSSRMFDDVQQFDQVLALKNQRGWQLLKMNSITKELEAPSFPELVDEVKSLQYGNLLLRKGNRYSIIRQDLTSIISFSDQEINVHAHGYLIKTAAGQQLIHPDGKMTGFYEDIVIHANKAAVRRHRRWSLIKLDSLKGETTDYDSIRFAGLFALKFNNDSVTVDFSKEQSFKLPATLSFISSADSARYLVVDTEGKKHVFDADGSMLFSGQYDQIQSAGSNIFVVWKREKKGLTDRRGKTILPVEYDAIGSIQNNVVSLLKNMKFGLYDVRKQKLLKPQYEKNLIVYNASTIGAYKDGSYHFISWENQMIFPHKFQEIQYWNDSVAWVKTDNLKALFNLSTGKIYLDKIEDIRWIEESPEEKLAIIRREKLFGVISSRRGIIIPVSFTDLVNVGSVDEPVYFTEKHVKEAFIFVVIYYDKNGRLLRREIYEDPEDYERIYCTDN